MKIKDSTTGKDINITNQQELFISGVNADLITSNLFAKVGVLVIEGNLFIFAVPRWVFDDMMKNEEGWPDKFIFISRIPEAGSVLSSADIDVQREIVYNELIFQYLHGKRKLLHTNDAPAEANTGDTK